MDPLSALAVGGLVESISGKVLDLAVGQATPKVRAWLKRVPAQLAFKAALLQAVNRFAADHPAWAAALMDEAFFTAEDTARELERFLTRRGAPDPGRLAKAWAGRLPGVAPDRRAEATQALADFLRLFEDELGKQEALRPLFDSRALEKITANTEALLDLLETTLLSLQSAWEKAYTVFTGGEIAVAGNVWGSVLISGHHNVVYQTIQAHDSTLRDAIYDFSDAIEELSRYFVGREFLLAEVEAFMDAHDRGVFRLVADAGLGKSAVAAVWARYFQAPVFFFGTRGSVSPARCLEHLCAELIGRYELDHDHLPTRAGEDANFLATVLREAHEKSGRPVVLVLDALDEAEGTTTGPWLPLPDPLPEGAYILVTHRPGDYPLPPSPERVFTLAWDDPRQQADIERYLRLQAHRLSNLLQAASVSPEGFVTALKQRSEGNFMYLTYVLGDIERREPGFHPLRLEGLPRGLQGYYDAFWRRMEEPKSREGYETWRSLYKPTLALLAVAAEPVAVDWLADHTGRDAEEIRERVLQPWRRFLRQERRRGKGFWSIVHQSFGDFLAEKIPLEKFHHQVADFYLGDPARWQVHENYALRYLSHHLVQAGMFNELAALIESPSWYAARRDRKYDSSRRPFAEDVKRALEMAEARVKGEGQVDALSLVIAWSLLYATERTFATNVPVEALEAMVILRQFERALDYAALITEPKQQFEAYRRIGWHLYEQGKKEKAKEILHRALEATKKILDEENRIKALIAVADTIAQIGDEGRARETLGRALKIAEKIGDPIWRAPALVAVAGAFTQVGDEEHARGALHSALEAAEKIDLANYHAKALADVAGALALVGDEEHAKDGLDRALKTAKKVRSANDRTEALTAVAKALAQVGNYEHVLKTAKKIRSANARAKALTDVAKALAQVGDEEHAKNALDSALKTAKKIRSANARAKALTDVAKALAQVGDEEHAKNALDSALKTAKKIDDAFWRAPALAAVAGAFTQVGDEEHAREALDRTLETAQKTDNDYARAEALTAVAAALAQVGDEEHTKETLHRTLRAAKKIDDDDARTEALTAAAPLIKVSLSIPSPTTPPCLVSSRPTLSNTAAPTPAANTLTPFASPMSTPAGSAPTRPSVTATSSSTTPSRPFNTLCPSTSRKSTPTTGPNSSTTP